MRTRLLALGCLLAVCLPLASAQEFKPHASAPGRYKVHFPGEPRSEATEFKTGKDKLTLTLDMVELKGDTVFMVSYVDATDEIAKTPAGPRLDKVRDGNKGEAGKILADKEIVVGVEKYPGRDILLETPSGFIRNRAVIAGNRLYQVMVQGSKDVVTSASADRFINSFEITK